MVADSEADVADFLDRAEIQRARQMKDEYLEGTTCRLQSPAALALE
jgi:hypothetical protein